MSSENLDDTKPLAGVSRPRFGQLTYTSFDRPALGRGQVLGGWQVKDVVGELDESEQDAVRAGINTRLETVVAPPAFPTQEQIESRPRRLHYGPLNGAAVAYWHSVQAGSDASGRPGNVFVHVLVDRNPELPPLIRPISLWHSPGWLMPYGAEMVVRSEIFATETFPAGDAVDLSKIVNFVLDPGGWRSGVLYVLLDAVACAVETGGTVVLGVEDPDRSALWIGAVSALMSASAASRFYFSTYERRPSVEDLEALNVHLVCVPVEDLAELELPSNVVVLSELETPSLGELDVEQHRTTRDVLVPVTEWSVLAQTVLLDPDTAATALGKLDAIAEANPVRGTETAWPLATLVLGDSDFSDAHIEAQRVVDHVPTPPVLRVQCEPAPHTAAVSLSKAVPVQGYAPELVGLTGLAPASAWAPANMQPREPSQILHDILAISNSTPDQSEARWLQFLEFVRCVPGWSSGPCNFRDELGRFEFRPSRRLLTMVEATAEDFFNRLSVMNSRAQSDNRFLIETEILRFADVIMFAGVTDDAIVTVVQSLVEWAVVPLLFDEAVASSFIEGVGAIDAPLRGLLRGCVTDGKGAGYFATRPLGARVPGDVIEWMLQFDDLPTDGRIDVHPEVVAESAVALASDLVLRKLSGPSDHGADGWGTYVPQSLWRLLWEAYNGGFVPSPASRLLSSPHLLAEDLVNLAAQFPGVIAPRFLQRIMLSHNLNPRSGELATAAAHLLCTDVEAQRLDTVITPPNRRGDETALAWAQVRFIDRWAEQGSGELQYRVGLMRPALIDYCHMNAAEIAELSNDILDRLAVLLFTSRWARDRHGAPFVPFVGDAQVAGLRRSILGPSNYVSANITELIRSRVIDREWLLVTVMLLTDGAPESERPTPDLLTSLGLGSKNGNGLLESLASESLADLYGVDRNSLSPIADMFRDEVRRRPPVDPPVDVDRYRPHAWQWFDYLVTAKAKQAPSQGFIARTFGKDKG
ncbi:hypothetical protein [Rhodococcus sp. IEGM 1379]|uniref:GAP1-N2 domain-containing protein n=1 Tax=Rhodococcus sp. IEGM 1379 TaxID=3047086 RepID=UPI0024B64F5C|nr:hypothetical protein [Rhodococcus sp. IEGM 1379]MDI9916347.1 hypothetical protein [Rhodococcus sp. IEGM 1379]